MATIQFDQADLERFAAASHDRNPLHLSGHYARRSAFGEPIVFGILGALTALASQPSRAGRAVKKLAITFQQPILVGVDYRVESTEKKPGQLKLSVFDAGQAVMSGVITYEPGAPIPWREGDSLGTAPTLAALALGPEEFAESRVASGRYVPDPGPFGELARDLKLADTGLSPIQVAAMLWSSYLVGMELPGERAIFSRLEFHFGPASASPVDPGFDYEARAAALDDRFDLLEIEADLGRDGQPIATAKITSYVRRDTPSVSLDALATAIPRSDALQGKLGLVIGGSRGLGAAIVAAMVTQGCDVILNYRAGIEEATALKTLLDGESGSVILRPGDASDPGWGVALAEELAARPAGLDFLVCNASPAIRLLKFTPDSISRFGHFVERSLAITSNPLAACLPSLARSSGMAVLVSSIYASGSAADYPADLVHYVAAKHASEGMVRALSAQSPSVRFLIARPPKLLTDQTNTSFGRQGALPVEGVAATIVRAMIGPDGGRLDILETF